VFLGTLYGSFPSHRQINFDQVPLEFACADLLRTYEVSGTKVIHVEKPEHKVERRECSLLLAFSATSQMPFASICLRGTAAKNSEGIADFRRPCQRPMQQQFADLKAQFPAVHIYVQKNGYFDSAVMMNWAVDFINDLGQGPFMVSADNLRAHCTPEFRELLCSAGIHLVYTPPGWTDLVQVVDAGIGYSVKRRMKKLFFDHYMANHNDWNSGKVSAANRRALHVEWLSTALTAFYTDGGMTQVHRIFKKCGLNNRLDGQDDEERVIPGYSGVINVSSFRAMGRSGADDFGQTCEIPTNTQGQQV